MIFNKSLLVSSLVLAVLSATSAAPKQVKGQTGVIISQSDFCLFLPPMYGGGISENEDRAVAFCTKPLTNAPKAGVLPRGFIKTAHFVENKAKGYVQVTGRMDGRKYGLSKKDGGGQYDIKAPRGARCHGYAHFVELVEPDSDIYCIRCCKKVLGGNYA
ncbi:hypothetical protein BGZ70_009647 [Mortierella alpina]|uniref:Uncharacterized protein n=1 Tax=Mortierella alpina TaxID=64518 RepID=A0A9P6M7A5_MORAP|nr:hypothetical protein BGZ70_009647 [Mortierella alpina]